MRSWKPRLICMLLREHDKGLLNIIIFTVVLLELDARAHQLMSKSHLL